MEISPLTQQGIDAYKAGDKNEAIRLLTDAVRENISDTNAWLYLGAAVDDPIRKRQCFEKVLELDPTDERARNALQRLNMPDDSGPDIAGASRSIQPMGGGARSGGAAGDAGERFRNAWEGKEGIKIPFNIPGAPETITIPEAVENGRKRILQASEIYTKQDFQQIISAGANATWWDSVFVAGVAAVVTGGAELFGSLIGWVTTFFAGGFGQLPWAFVQAALVMVTTGFAFAGGTWLSKMYLDSQNTKVSFPQHAMYCAMAFLPISLVSAALNFVSQSLGFLACAILPILGLVSIAASLYGLYLLWKAFESVYGTENNRGLITAAMALVGGAAGSILGGVMVSFFAAAFGLVFNVRF